MSITLTVNGEKRDCSAGTLAALLAQMGIDATQPGIAVACNGGMVRRSEWAGQKLSTGDNIEVIRPVMGG